MLTASEHIISEIDQTITFPDRRRFTRTDYWRMINEGLVELESPVELLNGELVMMSPIGDDHLDVMDMLTMFFAARGRQVCLPRSR